MKAVVAFGRKGVVARWAKKIAAVMASGQSAGGRRCRLGQMIAGEGGESSSSLSLGEAAEMTVNPWSAGVMRSASVA